MVSMVALPEAEGSIRRYTNMSEVMIPRLFLLFPTGFGDTWKDECFSS